MITPDMKIHLRYVVTKSNHTFKKGDHIRKLKDGSILCQEAGGWIDPEDVESAVKGMEYTLDREWMAEYRRKWLDAAKTLLENKPVKRGKK